MLLKAIATERRIQLIQILCAADGPVPTSTLAALTGMGDAQTSFNLTHLRELGLVIRTTSGRWSFYQPNEELLQEVFKETLHGGKHGKQTKTDA